MNTYDSMKVILSEKIKTNHYNHGITQYRPVKVSIISTRKAEWLGLKKKKKKFY